MTVDDRFEVWITWTVLDCLQPLFALVVGVGVLLVLVLVFVPLLL